MTYTRPRKTSTTTVHPLQALGSIAVHRFAITMRATTAGEVPGFLGSAIRGAIGWALWEQNCLNTDSRDAFRCGHHCNCIVGRMWLPNVAFPEGYARRYKNPPKPFVVQTNFHTEPQTINIGDTLDFNISLIGNALESQFFSHILPSIEQAIRQIGTQKLSFKLVKIEAVAPPQYKLPKTEHPTFQLHIQTPLSIYERDNLAKDLRFTLVLKSLMERLRNLSYLYARANWYDDDTLALYTAQLGEDVQLVDHDLKPVKVYREGGKEPLLGYVGNVTYQSESVLPLLPLLELSELVHLGKMAEMGFGRVQWVF